MAITKNLRLSHLLRRALFGIRATALSIALLSLSACTIIFVKNVPEGKSTIKPPTASPPIDVVLFVEARRCEWPPNLDHESKVECIRYGPAGYYPYEMVQYESNIFKVSGASTIAHRALSGQLDLPFLALRSSGANSPLGYRVRLDLINQRGWNAYNSERKANTLELRVRSLEGDLHWSLVVSYLTLGIFPGFAESKVEVTGRFYDANGGTHTLRSRSPATGVLYNHLVFFLWSGVYNQFVGRPNVVREHIGDVLQQTKALSK